MEQAVQTRAHCMGYFTGAGMTSCLAGCYMWHTYSQMMSPSKLLCNYSHDVRGSICAGRVQKSDQIWCACADVWLPISCAMCTLKLVSWTRLTYSMNMHAQEKSILPLSLTHVCSWIMVWFRRLLSNDGPLKVMQLQLMINVNCERFNLCKWCTEIKSDVHMYNHIYTLTLANASTDCETDYWTGHSIRAVSN